MNQLIVKVENIFLFLLLLMKRGKEKGECLLRLFCEEGVCLTRYHRFSEICRSK